MQIYLTDDSGRKFWNTNVSAGYAQGERNNLARHLKAIKSGNRAYAKVGIDAKSAKIVEEYDADECDLTDDELLTELLS